MPYVIINTKLLESEKAFISYEDRGFRYGDGVFETIRVHGGVPYQFDWHMERLRKGLHAIKINANLHTLHEQCRKLLKENAVQDGVLRVQVTRGIGSKGYLPDSKHPKAGATTVIETSGLPDRPDGAVPLWLSSYRKISPDSLPVQYKLCQGLSSTLARIEAFEKGCFDALLINQQGELCETSSGNVFWAKDSILYTPALTCGALEGAMRAAILRLSPYEIREIRTGVESLTQADEVFICNALWQVIPAAGLMPNNLRWKKSVSQKALHELINSDIANYSLANQLRWQ